MKYHIDGTKPTNGEIFVFGSNLAGVHGAGAALEANKNFGAAWGQGIGASGQSWAIPTKDYNINTCKLYDIFYYVVGFIKYAESHPELEFFITRIGCGLAGYKDEDIAPMFAKVPSNCNLPIEWAQYVEEAASQ